MDVPLSFARFFKEKGLEPYLFLLSKKMADGNVCLDIANLSVTDAEILADAKAYTKQRLIQSPLVGNASQKKPFIVSDNKFYLERYFNYETQFISNIWRLMQQENISEAIENAQKNKAFITSLYKEFNWQSAATLCALIHRFQIITGGPGTGKTTSIAKLLAILFYQNPATKILLAAPTGKAAVRMAESLQSVGDNFKRDGITINDSIIKNIQTLKPQTIHSLLGYIPDSIYFKHDAQNPLQADVVVVDECSMIDIALFAKLTNAIGNHTQLILLGDKNQLSSVEAGSLFGDICATVTNVNNLSKQYKDFLTYFGKIDIKIATGSQHTLANHIIELQQSHRFKDDSGIGKLSKAIINNNIEAVAPFFKNTDEAVTFVAEDENCELEKFASKYESYILEQDITKALRKINKARFLCAVKQGPQGVYKINALIEGYLFKKNLIHPRSEFYENRLVMVVKNQPELNLYNGDTGIIRNINGQLRTCFLNADGRLNIVPPALIKEIETAFAITIHKSQGSEFNEVMIVLPPIAESPLLNRELIYTAVTRAKQKVFICSNKKVLTEAMHKTVQRISGIVNRLKT